MRKKRFEVCPVSELLPGERRIETLGMFSVGVFNVDGEYYALKNDCPHQRAPLCEGKLTGTNVSNTPGEYNWTRDGQIVTCPWHGWEFDVKTGESVFNPHKVKAKTFEATAERSTYVEDTDASVGSESSVEQNCEDCGMNLAGEEPPVDTYNVEIENDTVVVYL